MESGSSAAKIVGGILLILLDAYCITEGRLPLKGRLDTVNLADNPTIFWAYAVGLGAIGLSAVAWGMFQRD